MSRYYTRVCNFYYGNHSTKLVNKKKSIPFNGIKEISFDQIEIITRNSKKIILINQIKYLPKLLKIKINLEQHNLMPGTYPIYFWAGSSDHLHFDVLDDLLPPLQISNDSNYSTKHNSLCQSKSSITNLSLS